MVVGNRPGTLAVLRESDVLVVGLVRRGRRGAGTAASAGPLGDLQPLYLGNKAANRLQEAPLGRVLQALGYEFDADANVLCFREQESKMRLIAGKAVERIDNNDADLTPSDGFTQS